LHDEIDNGNAGLVHRLNEAGYTVAIMSEPDRAGEAPKVSDYQVAQAAYEAAVTRWPKSAITLRQGTRVLSESCPGRGEKCGPEL
jgi:hypothetical protein